MTTSADSAMRAFKPLLSACLAVSLALCPLAAAMPELAQEITEVAEAVSQTTASDDPIVDWTTSGTCRWMIDAEGCLTVEPLPGSSAGDLGGYEYGGFGWQSYKDEIISVVVKNGVSTASTYEMFRECKLLESVDLSGLDTSKVTSMYSMFSGCSSLASVELSGLDSSRVTDMDSMFSGCSSLASVDLSGLDTSKVTGMAGMFSGCSSLASLDLSPLDTSRVTDMSSMFEGCSSLKSLDLSSFDTSRVTNMSHMFEDYGCLRTVTLGSKFSFEGNGTRRLCSLPTLNGDRLTGLWVSSADGRAYAPGEVPSNVAATYTAQYRPAPGFPDVDYGAWYAEGVGFCAARGLITGYADGPEAGLFGVGRPLTRAQLAMILWRAADPAAAGSCVPSLTPNLTGMADVEPGSWYVGAANWAVSSRVINGFEEGGGRLSFRPDEPVTAEQVAKIFCNYANGGEPGDSSALAGLTDRDDVSPWAEGAVAWARESGLMSGYDNGDGTFTFRPAETTARERAATVIMKAYRIGVLS